MTKEQDQENWIDVNWNDLNSQFGELHSEEWSCEEQLMKLVESDAFIDFCEEKYNNYISDDLELI